MENEKHKGAAEKMKSIHILYNPLLDNLQDELAVKCSEVLKAAGYQTDLFCLRSAEDTNQYIQTAGPGVCQMVISLNMAGFNLYTTGNCSILNRLTMNMVNFIDRPPEEFSFCLKSRMNYTMSFIFSKEKDAEYAREHFPHIRNIHWSESFLDYLPKYLEELDWRY